MRATRLIRLVVVMVAFVLLGATLGAAGAEEDSTIGVPGAEEVSGVGAASADGRTSSGYGWQLLACTSTSTTANPWASSIQTDRFVLTDPCLAVRIYPSIGSSWSLWILDADGNPTSWCPGCSNYVSSRFNYYPSSRDVFWYISGRSRDLGTYRIRICTSSTCSTTLVNEPFELVPNTAHFRSVAAQDGWVLETKETSNVGGTRNVDATTLRVGDNLKDRQYRTILSFDTSSLPNDAVVTGVTLRVRKKSVVGTNPFKTHGPLYVDIRKGVFGGSIALQSLDFQAAASRTRVGRFNATPLDGWYSAVLGSAANGRINLKGATQFRLAFKLDDNDDGGTDFIAFGSGDAGAISQPELIVQYYVP